MATEFRPPLITRIWAKDRFPAMVSQPLGRLHHLLDSKDIFYGPAGLAPNFDWPNPTRAKIRDVGLLTQTNSLVLTTLKSKDMFFGGAGSGPDYDWPNPSVKSFRTSAALAAVTTQDQYRDRLIDLLKSKDTFFSGPGSGPDYDWPNPRGYRRPPVYEVSGANLQNTLLFSFPLPFSLAYQPNPRGPGFPIDLRTHLVSGLVTDLQGKDQFFGLAGSPLFNWPVPPGPRYATQLRTWTDSYKLELIGQDMFFGLAGAPTFDWPVPKGPQYGISLRTFVDPTKINLRGQDTFFGAAGEVPAYDWPNPRGARRNPQDYWSDGNLNALLFVAVPFALSDWPNPRGPGYATSLRTFVDPLKWELVGQDQFFGLAGNPNFSWPVPPGYVYSVGLRGALGTSSGTLLPPAPPVPPPPIPSEGVLLARGPMQIIDDVRKIKLGAEGYYYTGR